jgi:hypothetical protein
MGIDFQADQEMVTLSNKDFAVFYHVFDRLNTKTGVMIDEYSDTLLSPDHTKILLDLIQNSVDTKILSESMLQLLNLFQKAVHTNTWIKIIGE